MSNMVLYMIGVFIVIAALGYGSHLAGLDPTWTAVALAVIVGLGVIGGVTQTRKPESPG
jgi:hypothetical protein